MFAGAGLCAGQDLDQIRTGLRTFDNSFSRAPAG